MTRTDSTEIIRVLLADDHATVREALATLVSGQPDMQVVGQAGDGDDAVEQARQLRPDVAVLDVSMPAMSGLEVTLALTDALPATRIVILTRHGEFDLVEQLLRAGASGYVLKQSASTELLKAIRTVASGGSYFDPLVAGKLANHYATAARTPEGIGEALTAREEQVLQLLARGYSNKAVAAELDISVKTVEAHKGHGMEKLGLENRVDLVRYALLRGWLRES
jgi:DNA-binding NarL/FixJ family response regulator